MGILLQSADKMDSLNGATLIKADGSKVEAEKALENKDLVLYYFSAHWCPPCRQFTPMLSDFYGEVSDDLEIVFVSSDRSPDDMISYMKESHGDWCGVEHNSALANDLKQKCGVQGIPMLVVVKKDGTLVTKDGRSHVVGKQPKQVSRDGRLKQHFLNYSNQPTFINGHFTLLKLLLTLLRIMKLFVSSICVVLDFINRINLHIH